MGISKRDERLGLEKLNKWNEPIKIVEYISAQNIIVEFQDECREQKRTTWKEFVSGGIVNPRRDKERLNVIGKNNQGCIMKVLEYKNADNVLIQFQDKYKYQAMTTWGIFQRGTIKNPYFPLVCGKGAVGIKYPASINGKETVEHKAWRSMLTRCYTKTYVNNENYYHRYEKTEVCEEWLLYENFYEWLHSQTNFQILTELKDLEVDKDILIKNNNLYAPNTCCIVPHRVNSLFIKANRARGKYPIGVTYKTRDDIFEVQCSVNGKEKYLGRVSDPIEGFYIYKKYKENIIKETAQEEYEKGNITEECYNAMINYEVEITD